MKKEYAEKKTSRKCKKEVELEKIDALVDDAEMLANEAENKEEVEAEIEFNEGAIEEPAGSF